MSITSSQDLVGYDEALTLLGVFRKWHAKIIFVLYLVAMSNGITVLVYNFAGFEPMHRCRIPVCDDSLKSAYNGSDNPSTPGFVKVVAPKFHTRSCEYFKPKTEVKTCSEYVDALKIDKTVETCPSTELVYDLSYVDSSVVTEFNLTCDNTNKGIFLESVFMIGALLGNGIYMKAADRLGRSMSLIIAIINTCSAILMGVLDPSSNFWLFMVIRFLNGFGWSGMIILCNLYVKELTPDHRLQIILILGHIHFVLGQFVMVCIANYVREWQMLYKVAHAPLVLVLLAAFLLPESPKWLLDQGREADAIDVLKKAFKTNHQLCPDEFFPARIGARQPQKAFLELFKSPKIMCSVMIELMQSFTAAAAYYVLMIATMGYDGNPYHNAGIGTLVEIPFCLCAMILVHFWKDRRIASFALVASGVAVFCTGILARTDPDLEGRHVWYVHLIAKGLTSAAFAVVNLKVARAHYTSSVRHIIVVGSRLSVRVGSFEDFLVQLFGPNWVTLYLEVIGALTAIAAISEIFVAKEVYTSAEQET